MMRKTLTTAFALTFLSLLSSPSLNAGGIQAVEPGADTPLPGVESYTLHGGSFFAHVASSCDEEAFDAVVRGESDGWLSGILFLRQRSENCAEPVIRSELVADDEWVYWVGGEGVVRAPADAERVLGAHDDDDETKLVAAAWDGGAGLPLAAQVPVMRLPVPRRPQNGPLAEPGPELAPEGPVLKRAPQSGLPEVTDTSEILASELTVPANAPAAELAQSEAALFVLTHDGSGAAIHSVRKSDGRTRLLRHLPAQAQDLQADGSHLYWLENGRLLRLDASDESAAVESVYDRPTPLTSYLVECSTPSGVRTRLLAYGGGIRYVKESPSGAQHEQLIYQGGDPTAVVQALAGTDEEVYFMERRVDTACRTCLLVDAWIYNLGRADRFGFEEPVTGMVYKARTARDPRLMSDGRGLLWLEGSELVRQPLCTECPREERDRGDVNGDGVRDVSDVTSIVEWLFLGAEPPACPAAADVNIDGTFDITDPSALVNFLFLGGPAPEKSPLTCMESPATPPAPQRLTPVRQVDDGHRDLVHRMAALLAL